MRRRRPGIGAELLPIALILICLAGGLGLVIAMHRRAQVTRLQPKVAPQADQLALIPKLDKPPQTPKPAAIEVVEEKEEPLPPTPVVDPTVKALAAIATEASEQERARREADSRSSTLLQAIKKAEAESKRWRTRESLAKTQLAELDRKAQTLDQEANALALDRDLLASERDAAKALVQKAKTTAGGYSVLPNKNPNGTWQRPVVIECREGEAILQPKGLHFNLLDLSPLLGPRGSPLIGAVARELLKIQGSASPDGAPIVPYIYFIVRPDGIRPFYDARSRLEPLGIAFGYELVEQDWEIEYPDFDAMTAWDGTGVPFSSEKAKPATAQANGSRLGGSKGPEIRRGNNVAMPDEGGRAFLWPADRPSPKATTDQVSDSPPIWPSRRGGANGRDSGSFLGSEEAKSWLDEPRAPASGSSFGPGSEEGFQPSRIPSGTDAGRQGGNRPPSQGQDSLGVGAGMKDPGSELVPISPDGLPDFSKPENLLPDPRRPNGSGDSVPSSGPTPKRPASGRVRLDPKLLAEAAAAEDEAEARKALLPFGESITELEETSPTVASATAAGATQASQPRPSEERSASTNSIQPQKDPQQPGTIAQELFGSNSGSKEPIPLSSPTAGSPSKASSSSSPASSGIEIPAPGSSSGEGRDKDKADALIYNPRKPLEKKSIRVPLDLVVVCGPNGVVIHPGGYRISPATLRKEGLLKTDLQTIVRNHELIDPLVKPMPRLKFLIETGGADIYSEARRQTVLSGMSWPVSVKVAESAGNTIFPKERF